MNTNPQFELAKKYIEETGCNLFLTGKAGTGKTTFLRYVKEHTKKRSVIVAPTGVAAINAGGVTIHSFFSLPFGPYVPESSREGNYRFALSKEKINIIRTLDLLIIDEVSMVRADYLDLIDVVLRRHRHSHAPFGGVQLLLIGDLYQLAPVVKEEEKEVLNPYYNTYFFFGSRALQQTPYITIELEKVYRQSDARFLALLNSIRENTATKQTFEELSTRYKENFRPPEQSGYITLTTHNLPAQRINDKHLNELPTPEFRYQAAISGDFPENAFPAEQELRLKVDAQIMFVKNDTANPRRFFNGKLGRVVQLTENSIKVLCDDWAEPVTIEQLSWENTQYTLNKDTKVIEEKVIGTFTHYPLRTAWAITIHKSQGLTFDNVIVDAAYSFAPGQVYVALSRCRTLEGIVLTSRLSLSNIVEDRIVTAFSRQIKQQELTDDTLQNAQSAYRLQLLNGLFDFRSLQETGARLVRVLEEHLYKLYPNLLVALKTETTQRLPALHEVSKRFALQYTPLLLEDLDENRHKLRDRIMAAAAYFHKELMPLKELLEMMENTVEIDNKMVLKRWTEVFQLFRTLLISKVELMHETDYAADGFDTLRYLAAHTDSILKNEKKKKPKSQTASAPRRAKTTADASAIVSPFYLVGKSRQTTTNAGTADILHQQLFDELRAWRKEKAVASNLPAFAIMHQTALIGIANTIPRTYEDLEGISGIGKKKIEQYGEELLTIVANYAE